MKYLKTATPARIRDDFQSTQFSSSTDISQLTILTSDKGQPILSRREVPQSNTLRHFKVRNNKNKGTSVQKYIILYRKNHNKNISIQK